MHTVHTPRSWPARQPLDCRRCRQLRQAGRRVLTRSFDTRSKASIDLAALAIKPGSSEPHLTTSARARSESGPGSFFALWDLTGCKSRQGGGGLLRFLARFFGVKTVALQGLLTLPQQRLRYSPRLLPIPSTYKLNGSSLGRPDVDLFLPRVGFQHSADSIRLVTHKSGHSRCVSF